MNVLWELITAEGLPDEASGRPRAGQWLQGRVPCRPQTQLRLCPLLRVL